MFIVLRQANTPCMLSNSAKPKEGAVRRHETSIPQALSIRSISLSVAWAGIRLMKTDLMRFYEVIMSSSEMQV